MSRRKTRGLTRIGRMVSEDPDLDNLLSNLSPEEMEELEKEVLVIPDLGPDEGRVLEQPVTNAVRDRDGKLDSREHPGKLSQREQSTEAEPRRESRKQEYLRKMGLSQEGKEGEGIQRQSSISTDPENKMEERNSRGPDRSKEDRVSRPNRYMRGESKDKDTKEITRDRYSRGEVRESLEKVEPKDRENHEDTKLVERRDNRLSTSSKTKDMISKLQEKKDREEIKEKERKEESRKRDDSKTKDLISKLQEKKEKEEIRERERREEVKRRDDSKTRGLVSKFVEKKSHAEENKAEEKKPGADDDRPEKGKSQTESESGGQKQEVKEEAKEKVKEDCKENKKDVGLKGKESFKKNSRGSIKDNEMEDKVETEKKKDSSEGLKANRAEEQQGNCVGNKISPSKTKVEEEEDEDSSMFDDLMEQVRRNDQALTELNVNNSEVIKAKTLIQFAEALNNNTHVKTFALANCRADDHVAYAIAGTLRANASITSINLDSNHLTPKGIMALIQALQKNTSLTELRFHNQRHICGGKTEMEMTKILKDNTTLLKLGYGFELAGPRMTMTNILSRNMDKQRQRRLQEQKLAQANGDKKGTLEVPKVAGGFLKGSPKASPKPSPHPSPMASPKLTRKRGPGGGQLPPPPPGGPPPPPGGPPPPPPPMLNMDSLRCSLTPASQRKMDDKANKAGGSNSRDQLLNSIRSANMKKLKKVAVPKLLQ
ncbi:hypothetical protein DPEC_G00207590 [Dallia pectoralis]|uniref:Uncharacterized protein n=1 Tax=Dallia pectoralis TaxID=75939 RepID=A0ACC2G585_DALPE|nr:hypothetical protein DPEC_G00207590 [Dallia pectoralis]